MDREDKKIITALLALIVIFLVLIGFSVNKDVKKVHKCHDLGGIYINHQCFEAKVIKLD